MQLSETAKQVFRSFNKQRHLLILLFNAVSFAKRDTYLNISDKIFSDYIQETQITAMLNREEKLNSHRIHGYRAK